jgi:hypothetical protein
MCYVSEESVPGKNVSGLTRVFLRGGAIGNTLATDESQHRIAPSNTHGWLRWSLAISLCKFYAHGIDLAL